MLRSDGTFVIYVIQHKFINTLRNRRTVGLRDIGNGSLRDEWRDSNLDHFLDWDEIARQKHLNLQEAFSASGTCWQTTGIKGSFSAIDMAVILPVLERQFPRYNFRGKEVTITQRTKILVIPGEQKI